MNSRTSGWACLQMQLSWWETNSVLRAFGKLSKRQVWASAQCPLCIQTCWANLAVIRSPPPPMSSVFLLFTVSVCPTFESWWWGECGVGDSEQQPVPRGTKPKAAKNALGTQSCSKLLQPEHPASELPDPPDPVRFASYLFSSSGDCSYPHTIFPSGSADNHA